MRDRTRSGRVAARGPMLAPPSRTPPTTGRSAPTASITARVSETRVSRFAGPPSRLAHPLPPRPGARAPDPALQVRGPPFAARTPGPAPIVQDHAGELAHPFEERAPVWLLPPL